MLTCVRPLSLSLAALVFYISGNTERSDYLLACKLHSVPTEAQTSGKCMIKEGKGEVRDPPVSPRDMEFRYSDDLDLGENSEVTVSV